jgi:hypothetical protein
LCHDQTHFAPNTAKHRTNHASINERIWYRRRCCFHEKADGPSFHCNKERVKKCTNCLVTEKEKSNSYIGGVCVNALLKNEKPKPALGVYKLNVDVAFDPDTGRGATGAIIRDSGGNFIVACCDHTDHAIDVATMEASALLDGLKLVQQFGASSGI